MSKISKTNVPVLRLGIIGLGLAGAGMIPSVLEDSRFRLAAAADPSAVLRARFAKDHDCPTFESAEALLGAGCVDAVYIATPHQMHKEHVVAAAKHGIHAVVEKPMALSLSDCDAMQEAVNRSGTVLIVGHTHSFDPSILRIREIVQGGTVGRVAMITMLNYTDFLYRPRRPEELDTSRGGGILFNQVPHQVDTARFITGTEVTSVRAESYILDPRRPTQGCCNAFIGFADGATATLTYSGYDHFDSDELHAWIGEGGERRTPSHGKTRERLSALGNAADEANARIARGYGAQPAVSASDAKRLQPHFGSLVVTCEHADIRQTPAGIRVYRDSGPEDIEIPCATQRPGRSNVLDELYGAVVLEVPPVHNGAFGRGTLAACLAILESSRSHVEVRLISDDAAGDKTPPMSIGQV